MSRPPPPAPRREIYAAGQVVNGKYVLQHRLGVGGMGEVWSAYSRPLEVSVAIKLASASDVVPDRHERLRQEARLAARVRDPGVVQIFDSGETEQGDPFIVMELLEGVDLFNQLSDGLLTPIEAVRVILPIVRAVHTMHRAGVIHRDLKPENIFLAQLSEDRIQPKLLDFGIARTSVPTATRLTNPGALLGSPIYMSPEQAAGAESGASADVWALCVILYECVQGEVPFDGDNYNAVLQAILHTTPAPLTGSEERDALWRILERGLVKDPSQRWPSVGTLAAALAGFLLEHATYTDVTGLVLEPGSGEIRRGTSWSQPPRGRTTPGEAPPTTGPNTTPGESFRSPAAFAETLVGHAEHAQVEHAQVEHAQGVAANTSAPPPPPRSRAPRYLLLGAVALLGVLGLAAFLSSQPQPGSPRADDANLAKQPPTTPSSTAAPTAGQAIATGSLDRPDPTGTEAPGAPTPSSEPGADAGTTAIATQDKKTPDMESETGDHATVEAEQETASVTQPEQRKARKPRKRRRLAEATRPGRAPGEAESAGRSGATGDGPGPAPQHDATSSSPGADESDDGVKAPAESVGSAPQGDPSRERFVNPFDN